MTSRRFRFPAFVALALAVIAAAGGTAAPLTRVLIVVGPGSHAPGTHEPAAGARLLSYCLERAPQPGGFHAQVYHEWPADESVLDAADTVVFLGDRFPPMRLPDSPRIMQQLAAMMERGCGLVGLHFATGLRGDEVAADGDHPLLRWMGGYFLTAPATNRSIARVLTATISPGERMHPVHRGWREFELRDEPYFRNFFGPAGMAPNVTPLATALLPPDEPRREVVAWAVERTDGGRGVAVVMPHFYRNWQLGDLRTLILNGIVWSAKREVPDNGVQVNLPDPATFWPAAVEPLTPAQKAAPRPVTERRIELDAKPLNPAANPLFTEYVNRDRVYDFYEKQALDTLHRPDRPALLPPWPGLDGGKTRRSRRPGHFGNQTSAMAISDAWNQMDGGSVQAGGMELAGSRPRAVAVRLGDRAAVFDPDTLTWPAAFRDATLKRGTSRFGFTEGLQIEGEPIPLQPTGPAPAGSFRYLGYYRHGERAVFAYERDGVEWLESAEKEAGGVAIRRELRGEGPLTGLTRGGPAQWPQTFVTRGKSGDTQPYAFDELPPPEKTPWSSIWHFGGHDFLPNGDAVLCTIEGEVWVVSGLDDTLSRLRWRRFAAGLNQPLGLRVVDGRVCVLGRDQITRLHDLNGDGEADYYESLCHTYDSSATGHAFITDLQRDREGRFIFVSGRQGVVRTSTDMKSVEVLATGLRNPNGLGLGPGGEISVAPQEGFWTPASVIYEFQPEPQAPPHFGFGGPKPELGARANVPPLVYFPRGEDNSSGGQCYVEGDRWGVPAGTLVHFSWGMGTAFLVLRERSGNAAQGAIVPLPGNFRSGAHRAGSLPSSGTTVTPRPMAATNIPSARRNGPVTTCSKLRARTCSPTDAPSSWRFHNCNPPTSSTSIASCPACWPAPSTSRCTGWARPSQSFPAIPRFPRSRSIRMPATTPCPVAAPVPRRCLGRRGKRAAPSPCRRFPP